MILLELLNKISSDTLVLVCVILSAIALFLVISIAIEVFFNKRKLNLITPKEEPKLNIKIDDNIKYVEEDAELEKTKAKLELERLKIELAKREEEKLRLVLENETLLKEKEIQETKVVEENKSSLYQELEEENAIISYEELKKVAEENLDDKYTDEQTAIISIQELDKLYDELNTLNEVQLIDFTSNAPDKESSNKFQNSPVISPVYGVGNPNDIVLNNTADLEKLNDEIKKTNEFLKTLKEFRKNLP